MLFATKSVRVKLLPFDNKSEIAVVVDLPHGTSLEETDRLLTAAAERLKDLPELTSIQSYTGTAAPFNFNGLVRHYYMRRSRRWAICHKSFAQGRTQTGQSRHCTRYP